MSSGIVMAVLALAFMFLIFNSLTSGSVKPVSSSAVNGTVPAQGTGTSTITAQQYSVTSTFTGTPLTWGTGNNQVNLIVTQDRTIAASSSETLDLYGSSTPLDDLGGAACLFRHIKFIMIYILPNTGDINGLTIGGAASDPWLAGGAMGGTTPTAIIYPNGTAWQLGEPTAGFAVTTGAGQLKVTNNSIAVATNYRLVIGGTTT